MNLTTRCPHCGNPRQRHHHESPWCDGCLRSLFDRLDRLEAIAAAQDTPSSPANAPEVPQGQTGDSDGTERIRVTKENPLPGWAYDLDGECICCGEWSYHAPGCKLDAAIRVWRKVQACVSGSEISTIDESGVLIRAGNGLNLDGLVLVGANVWYSTASGLLAWLKDGEA